MIKSKETGACYENWKRERSPAYQRRRNEDGQGTGRGGGERRNKKQNALFIRKDDQYNG